MNSKQTLGNRHGSAVITLPSDTEILITRVFDAPADLVFQALMSDAILASGMESGLQVSYDRLEDLVRQAAAG